MIIQCDTCGTRYNLAEEKVKPGGTKVRCARCRSVFQVAPPTPEPLPPVEAFPSDLGAEDWERERGADLKSEDTMGEGTIAAEKEGMPFSTSHLPNVSSDFRFGGEEISEPSPMGEMLLPPEPDSGIPTEPKRFPPEGEFLGSESQDTEKPEEDFSPPPSLTSLEDKGAPVDFVRKETRKRGTTLLTRLLLVLILVLAALTGGLAGYLYWSGEPFDASRLMDRLRGGGRPAPETGRRIHLTGIEGFFVINRDAGRLFVIRGMAVNEFPEPRGTISVKGVLYDTTGKPIAQKIAFCGNSLDDEAIRTLPFRKIEEAMKNQFGTDFANLTTAPGKSIPFTVVFQNVPDKLAEFSVDVNDSTPVAADR